MTTTESVGGEGQLMDWRRFVEMVNRVQPGEAGGGGTGNLSSPAVPRGGGEGAVQERGVSSPMTPNGIGGAGGFSLGVARDTLTEELLRPLVEATVLCGHEQTIRGEYLGYPAEQCLGCHIWRQAGALWAPELAKPDPRFEALRGKGGVLGEAADGAQDKAKVDASLGAIVRAIGACDLVVTFLSASGLAQIDSLPYRSHGPMRWREDGDTPEEGLALALVAAWRAESKP